MSHAEIPTDKECLEIGIPGFWETIRDAPQVALMLDYDGTLAPFHVDRLKAIPLDGIVDALHDLQQRTDTHVAIVSGRPISELLALMPDPGVTIIGTHGYELRSPGKPVATFLATDRQQEVLDRAEKDAQRIVGKNRTERKVATVAAHFRGLDRLDTSQIQRELEHRWLDYADTDIVEVRQFNGGLEMRSLGRHKGTAVAEFLDSYPHGTLAVYVGDDDTDEDAFRVLAMSGGYGILVGESLNDSAAQGSLQSCDDVLRFLREWIKERQR